MGRYGLIGERLSHSFSKGIHEAFGEYSYELMEKKPEELETFLKSREFAAINVTIPYKQQVIPYLDGIDPAAREIGAVNTIVQKDGKLYGHNTDFAGFSYALMRAGIQLEGKKVLILGSGGTSKTVAAVCKKENAASVIIVSRTPEEGQVTYEQAQEKTDTQILINTSPVGMFPHAENTPITLSVFPQLEAVADVIYNPLKTRLLLEAEKRGLPCTGGLPMLVAQARYASELFTGNKLSDSVMERVYQSLWREKSNLVFIGMPMSGKTTLGKRVSALLNKRFVDVDDEIVKETHLPIPEFFSRFGEAEFRKKEKEVIRRLSCENGLLISTGGGSVLLSENVENLKKNGVVCLIDRPLSLLKVGADRPLAKSEDEIKNLFETRYPLYLAASDYSIENSGSREEAVDKILEGYHEAAHH